MSDPETPDAAALVPAFLRVRRRIEEIEGVVTLAIGDEEVPECARPQAGQFNMLYAFGVGEVPISLSGEAGRLVHTVRAAGAVTSALTRLRPDDVVGVRGPYGSVWPLDTAAGCDVLVIAGGIGLAPLRPVLYHLLRERARYGRVGLLYGARNPDELLYRDEIDAWRRTPGLQVRVTVDHAGPDWIGDVGVVTKVLHKIRFDPVDTVAMICGPEVMIRITAALLTDIGVDEERVYVSLERNMRCAQGWCGHCQFGPEFVCRDGPVFELNRVRSMLNVREI